MKLLSAQSHPGFQQSVSHCQESSGTIFSPFTFNVMFHFNFRKWAIAIVPLLIVLLDTVQLAAQPTWLGTQVVNGSYNTYPVVQRGGARFARLQASSSAAALTRNWEFTIGGGSPDYSTNWRPYSGACSSPIQANVQISGYNTRITPVGGFPATTASATRNTGFGGCSGFLPAVTSGNYYTFNVGNNGGGDNDMSVLETTYNPVSINSVSSPLLATAFQRQSVTVTATLSAPLNAGESCVIRWTNNGFASSSFINMTLVSGSTYRGIIPGQTSAVTVEYYVLTTNDFGSISHANADFLTLNMRNQSGENTGTTNFSYAVSATAVRYTVNNGSWGTAATWDGGVSVPASGAVCIINNTVTYNVSSTVGSLVVNNGANLTTADGTARTLTLNTGATVVNEGTWTNSTNSTFTFSGTGTVRGTAAITLQNVNIAGGVDFGTLGSGGLTTINNILRLNSGGFVNTNGVIYGSSSTLEYTTNFTCGAEWYAGVSSGVGVPQNITANAAITITQTGSAYRRVNGNFTSNNNSGTLTLSTSPGGDFEIGGNLTFSNLNPNNRFITFLGSGDQTWNRNNSGDITAQFVRINKPSGRVIIGANIGTLTINGLAGSTLNCLETQSATSILDINGRTLALGQRCSFVAGGGLYAGTPGTASGTLNLINGNASTTAMTDWGTLRFVSTNPRVTNFTVNTTGGSAPGVTLGTNMMAGTTNLNGGTLKIGGNNFNTSTAAGGLSGSVGAVSVGNGGTLFLVSNGHTGTCTFEDGSTVTHIGNSGDNVRGGVSYYNLTFNGSGGTKTLANGGVLATEVRNDLTINSGVTFLVGNRILNVTGTGTRLTGAGTVTVGNGTGAGFVTVSGNWGGPALTLQNNVGSVVRVNGNVTAAGTFNFNSLVGVTFMLMGDWLVENAFSNNTNGGLIYLAGDNQQLRPNRTSPGASLLIHRLRLKSGVKTLPGVTAGAAGFATVTVSDSINLMNGATIAFSTANTGNYASELIINGSIGGPASGANSPAGQIQGDVRARVTIGGSVAFSAGTIRFTSDLLGELNFTRSGGGATNSEMVTLGTNLTVNAYTFPNNSGFVRVANSSTFTLTGNGSRPGTGTAYSQSNHQSGNGQTGAQRFFALGQGSKYVFAPTYAVLAGTLVPYPVGPDVNDANFATFFEGLADGTINIPGTTAVTGTGTFFNDQLAIGQQLVSPSGTVIGTITAIASNTGATIASAATYSGQFRIRKAYRPFQLGPVGADVATGYSMEVEFFNHSGGGSQTATNIPTIDGSRRTNYLFRLTPHATHPTMALRHDVLVSSNSTDFNASMTYNETAFYRYTGVWERVAANTRTPLTLTPGTRTTLTRNTVETPATSNTYAVGQTGGGLPNDPSYLWTGTSGTSWTNPANWTPLGVPPATFPNSSTHNVIITGGANNVVLPAGTFSVNNIQHSAQSLTVSTNANLEVAGNYNLNFPAAAASAGTGTISSTGTNAVTGDGTLFTTDLAPGSYLYDAQSNLFYGIVQSIGTDLTLTLANMANSSGNVPFSNIPAGTGFNYITPASSLQPGTITATAGSRDVTITGGTFNSTMLGRVILDDGTNAYIGVIAGLVNSTTARMAAEAPASYSGNFRLRGPVNPIGTGTLVCQPSSFVNYGASEFQNIAHATYAKIGFRDSRPNATGLIAPATAPLQVNRYVVPTGRTIVITDSFITRAAVKAVPITGTQFQFTGTSSYKAILPAFIRTDLTALGLGTSSTFRSYDSFDGHPAIVWGPSTSALIDMVFDNRNNSPGAYNFQGPDAAALVEAKVRNFTIISRGNNTITTPNGFNMTVKGTFELQKTGPAARALQLGNAATPNCTVTLLGPIINGQFIGRGGSQLPNFNILGTGSITGGDIFEAFYSGSGTTPSIQSLTINRPGVTVTLANATSSQHLVAAGDITISNGTLSRAAGGNVSAQGNMTLSGTGAIAHGGTGSVGGILSTSVLSLSGSSSVTHSGVGGVGSVGDVNISGSASWNFSSNTATTPVFGSLGNFTMTGGTVTMPTTGDFFCQGNFSQNGGTITKTGGNFYLFGNVSYNGGTRNTSAANIRFSSATLPTIGVVPAPSGLQTLSSTSNQLWTINDLVIDKASGNVDVAANTRLRILGTLNLVSSSTVTATGNIILGSTATGTARIAQLPNITSTSQLLGSNWTVEKYVNSATTPGWHFIGTSIQGQTLSGWGDDFAVNTPQVCPNTTTVGASRTNFFTFDGTTPDPITPNEKNGWRIPTICNVQHGRGYRAFLGAPFFAGTRVLDNTGAITHGMFNFGVSFNPGGYSGGGWNLVANPYPSAIDWNVPNGSGWDRTNMLQTYWTWNKSVSGGGSYATYGFGAPSGTNGATQHIPTNQGFFVEAQSGGNMELDERVKSNANPAFLRTAEEYVNAFKIGLSNATNTERDEVVIYQREEATDGFDTQWDGPKIKNPGMNFSTYASDGRELAINAFAPIAGFKVIKTNVGVQTQGLYKFDFKFLGQMGTGVTMYLRDNYLGTIQQIVSDEEMYHFNVTADPISQGDNRFDILFGNGVVTANANPGKGEDVKVFPNPSNGSEINLVGNNLQQDDLTIAIFDMAGKMVYSTRSETVGGRLNTTIRPGLSSGVYTIRLFGKSSVLSFKHIVK